MAITDMDVVGNTPYCKIGNDVYLWKLDKKNIIVLTDDNYRLLKNYYPNYATLTTIPNALDTHAVTKMENMFIDFESLISAPEMDASNVVSMRNMFGFSVTDTNTVFDDDGNETEIDTVYEYFCVNMTSIPQYNTSNVTDFSGMFFGCESLTTVPELDMSKAENVSSMFQGCTSLPKIFPWVINFDNLVEYNNNDANKFKGMFEGSSVEEITIMMNNIDGDENLVPNTKTGLFDAVLTVTPENLDSTGTLKKINVIVPGFDPEKDENAQRIAEHYLVRIR